MGVLLYFVNSFDEVEKRFGAFGFIRDFAGGMIGRVQNGVILEILKDIAIDVEFLRCVHVDLV